MTGQSQSNDAKKIHPVAVFAARQVSQRGKIFVYEPSSIEAIEAELKKIERAEEVRHAMSCLVDLAHHLERDRKSPDAASALLMVAAKAVALIDAKSKDAENAAQKFAEASRDSLFGEVGGGGLADSLPETLSFARPMFRG
jgi:hypothetical protein